METNTCVLYTDGSYRQFGVLGNIKEIPVSQGAWGSGIHGYIYPTNMEETKTSDTPTGFTITNIGYINNQRLKEHDNIKLIKPTKYIDGVVTTNGIYNIGAAELLAIKHALEWILKEEELNIDNVKLHIDSEYAILTINALFINNNIEAKFNANLDIIDSLREIAKTYKDKKISIEIFKIKSHTGEIGNELADQLAKLARNRNIFGIHTNIIKVSSSSKYWNSGDNRHPFLRFNSLFFTHNMDKNNNGYNMYSIMEYKSNVEVGEKTHEATFGLILLKDTPKIVTDVIDFFQHTLPMSSRSILATVDLKSLFNNRNILYNNIVEDNKIFRLSNRSYMVVDPMDNAVARPVIPTGIGNKALSLTLALYTILDSYLNSKSNNDNIKYIDITDKFYTKTVNKKNVEKYVLNFKQDTRHLPIDAIKDKVLSLTIGIDTLSYNQLKAIEEYKPKITLITITTNKIMEYYTVVNLDNGDVGIFCNLYSNKILC